MGRQYQRAVRDILAKNRTRYKEIIVKLFVVPKQPCKVIGWIKMFFDALHE